MSSQNQSEAMPTDSYGWQNSGKSCLRVLCENMIGNDARTAGVRTRDAHILTRLGLCQNASQNL